MLNALGLSTAAATVKNWAFTSSNWALNTALYANPIGIVIAAVVGAIAVIALAIIYWDDITGAVRNAWKEHKDLITVIGILLPGMGLIVLGARLLADNWDAVSSALETAWEWMQRMAGVDESILARKRADAMRGEVAALKESQNLYESQGLKESDLYRSATAAIREKEAAIKQLDASTSSLTVRENALAALAEKRANLQGALDEATSQTDRTKIGAMLSAVQDEMSAIDAGQITEAMKKAETDLRGSTEKLKDEARRSGSATMDAWAEGVRSNSALPEALKGQLNAASALMPHSDAKEGPFSRLTASGRAVITTMAGGIKDAGSGLKDSILTTFQGLTFSIPTPVFAGIGGVAPVGPSSSPAFRIDIENLIGELRLPEGRSGRGTITDLSGMITEAIKKAAEQAVSVEV
jgi:hypothetical protein